MSRKKAFTEPYEAPSPEEVQMACDAIGGKGNASRLLRKNWSTVDKWCKGKTKVDYANWLLLADANCKRICGTNNKG